MNNYNLVQIDEDKQFYVCPVVNSHKFKTVNDWIGHLCQCGDENKWVKYFVCRFNHFHWFNTQRARVIHEAFECQDQARTMPHLEVMMNRNNELIIPLTLESEIDLRTYFKQGNFQPRPDFINFFNQFKQDNIELIECKEVKKKVKIQKQQSGYRTIPLQESNQYQGNSQRQRKQFSINLT